MNGTRGFILTAGAAALAVMAAGLAATSTAQPAGAAPRAVAVARTAPVVVELFTAQGCDGCPEANQRVEALAAQPGVIALTYPVDYWDWLGWTDTLAQPEFADRQRSYIQPLRLRAVATPQVIIDGRRPASAADETALLSAVEAEQARRDAPLQIEFRARGDRVGIGSGRAPRGGAEVTAVVYAPGLQTVQVESGDNRGRTVRQVNVVRRIAPLGRWTGAPVLFALPDVAEDEAVVVLVQARDDRAILTAAAR